MPRAKTLVKKIAAVIAPKVESPLTVQKVMELILANHPAAALKGKK